MTNLSMLSSRMLIEHCAQLLPLVEITPHDSYPRNYRVLMTFVTLSEIKLRFSSNYLLTDQGEQALPYHCVLLNLILL